jgi:hypothetical protein
MHHRHLLLAFACLGGLAPLARAGFTQSVVPPFRGAPCTRFAGWETFTQPHTAPNAPDVPWSTTQAPALTQLVPGAILTTTGNIYHPSQAPQFELGDVAGADVQEVVLQVSTFGNPPDGASFVLVHADGAGGEVVLAPTESQVLTQGGGHDEVLFRWDLSSAGADVRAYQLRFGASLANSSLDALLLDVREACAPGAALCLGDGTGAACPCANSGAPGHGCANSVSAAGGLLEGTGAASLAADTLVLRSSSTPSSTCLFLQGTSAENGGLGVILGDGLRCVGGTIVRLGSTLASGGNAQYPSGTQAPVSTRGGITTAGTSVVYQTWYRNASALFCTPETSNLTNGYVLTWQP